MTSRPDKALARVVVITGASSGIGRCTAGLFARRGWRVGLIARGQAGLLAACADVEGHGAVAAMAQADVPACPAVEAAVAALEPARGPVAAWGNGAGNGTFGRFMDTPPEAFRRVTDVTYLGTVNGTRLALRRFLPRDAGCVVNVCSAVAYHGMPLLSSYSGAKHAVRGFDQAVRAELTQDGSRVALVTLFPPAVNTPFFDHAASHMGRPGRPMPPVYQPEIVAEAIHLAASSGGREMPISFTTVMFSVGMRLVPGLVDRAIRRLGYEGQLTDDALARARYEPTLFAPSEHASPARGGFGATARAYSRHLRLLRLLARLKRPGRHWRPVATRTPSRLPNRPVLRGLGWRRRPSEPAPDPARAGSGERPPGSSHRPR